MNRRRSINRSDAVVAILCLILALLTLGAVGRQGRKRAREAVCLSNLRQWNAIFQDHLERNNERFFTGGTPQGYWWPRELDEEQKNWKRTKIWFCPEADTLMIDEDGVYSNTTPIFAAWGIYNGADLGPHGLAGSYGLNGYTIDIPESGRYEGSMPGHEGWRSFDAVPHADNVPWFVDALRFDLWPLYSDAPAAIEFAAWTGNNMTRCCINRHNGAVNCLFLDGSARKVGLKELWTLKWHRSFHTAGPWTKAGGVQPSDWPAWMRDFKDY